MSEAATETTTKTEYSPEEIEAEKQRLAGKKTTETTAEEEKA